MRKEIDMTKLPPWKMNDDGTITCSSLKHADALLYTFVEVAITHNDKILEAFKKVKAASKMESSVPAELVDGIPEPTPALPPDPMQLPLTKQSINHMLSGTYSLTGMRKWWYRPRKALGMQTPAEAWEEDPQRVFDLAKTLLGGTLGEQRD